MHEIRNEDICCPYCGERIVAQIDCSAGDQRYVEDCQVCCRPIEFDVQIDLDGTPAVSVFSDNE